jgi:hypothetical protein
MEPDVPPVPSNGPWDPSEHEEILKELQRARSSAVTALLEAREAEVVARGLRRKATALLKHYERLLQEHNGQLHLPYERSVDEGQD